MCGNLQLVNKVNDAFTCEVINICMYMSRIHVKHLNFEVRPRKLGGICTFYKYMILSSLPKAT